MSILNSRRRLRDIQWGRGRRGGGARRFRAFVEPLEQRLLLAADLRLVNHGLPEAISIAEPFRVEWTVRNAGDSLASSEERCGWCGGGWQDAVYLSADALFDQGDVYLGSAWRNDSLSAGGEYTASIEALIGPTAPGRRFMLIVADDQDYVNEGDAEGNNVRSIPVLLRGPDLAATQLSAPSSASTGEAIISTWTVTNVGNGSSGREWYDRLYLSTDDVWSHDDVALAGEPHLGNLAPGESVSQSTSFAIPPVAPGDWWLILATDSDDWQPEFWHGGNNLAAVPIRIEAPDLRPTRLEAPTTGGVSQALPVQWSVKNFGPGDAASAFSDRLYLSRDTLVSADDQLLGETWWNGPLPSGGEYHESRSFLLPSVESGDYYLLLSVDPTNYVAEGLNEGNNLLWRPLRIEAPDLITEGVANQACLDFCAPAEAVLGGEIAVQWTVRNRGDQPTAGGWLDELYLSRDAELTADDVRIGSWHSATPLAPGEQYSRRATVSIPRRESGSYYLFLTTAWDASVDEGTVSKANNVAMRPIELTAPDLVPSFLAAPSSGVLGQSLLVSYSVTNQGDGTAGEHWTGFYLSRDEVLSADDRALSPWHYHHSAPLSPSQTYAQTVSVTLPAGDAYPWSSSIEPGDWFLLLQADVYGSVFEGQGEANNVVSRPLRIDLPDLVPSGLTGPVSANPGEAIPIRYSVENFGTGPVVSGWSDYLYLSRESGPGAELVYAAAPWWSGTGLDSGAAYSRSTSMWIPPWLEPGIWYVHLIIDGGEQVFEGAGEVNNRLSVPLHVLGETAPPTPRPDLAVTEILPPSELIPWTNALFEWTVTNQGEEAATGGWYDRLYLSRDGILSSDDVFLADSYYGGGGLPAGESYTQAVEFSVPAIEAGPWFVIVAADFHGWVHESVETNNSSAQSVSLITPDIRPLDLAVLDAAVPRRGMGVTWTVENQGLGNAVPNWYDSLYLSRDGQLSTEDIPLGSWARHENWWEDTPVLATGEQYTRSVEVFLPDVQPGAWTLLLRVDGGDVLHEGWNEANNVRALPIEVVVTDLAVSNIVVPNSADAGDYLIVTWDVANVGGASSDDAYHWYDELFLSRDAVWTPDDISLVSMANPVALSAGDSYTQSAGVFLPFVETGEWHLIVRSDTWNQVFEGAGKINNVQARPIQIVGFDPVAVPAPDLALAGEAADYPLQFVAPAEGTTRERVAARWTVRNQGEARVGASWSDAVFLSRDDRLSSDDIALTSAWYSVSLAAGGQYSDTVEFTVPDVMAGDWFLIFSTDYGNAVAERRQESNNLMVQPFRVRTPDLAAQDFDVPAEWVSGQSAGVTWTVRNVGDGAVGGYWSDTIWLSRDPVYTIDDQNLGGGWFDRTQAPLAPNTDYTESVWLSLPNIEGGDWYLILQADGGNGVFENHQESNNFLIRPIHVSRPDLAPESFTAPASADAESVISVSWTVRNNGNGLAEGSWADGFYLSRDSVLTSDDMAIGYWHDSYSLAPHEDYSRDTDLMLPAVSSGRYYLFVRVDDWNAIHEGAGEGNNVLVSVIDIQGSPPTTPDLPDLVVTSVVAPVEVGTDRDLPVQWTVRNEGTASADSWYDSVWLSRDQHFSSDDLLLSYFGNPAGLEPGQQYPQEVTVRLPRVSAGPWFVLVRADEWNLIDERGREGNNFGASAQMQVGVPDLVAESFQAPAVGTAGHSLVLSWMVSNQGTATALEPWYDSVYLSRDNVPSWDDLHWASLWTGDWWSPAPLEEQETMWRTVEVLLPSLPAGDWNLILVVDSADYVFEDGAEANNILVRPLQLHAPDLIPLSLTAPEEAVPGQWLDLQWNVRNQGTGGAQARWDVFYLSRDAVLSPDDHSLGYAHSGPLGPNADTSGLTRVYLPQVESGDWFLLLDVDGYAAVFEDAAENNNLLARPLRLELPDLVPTGDSQQTCTVLCAPDEATAGSEIFLSWTVRNQGTGTASGLGSRVYLSRDTTLTSDDQELATDWYYYAPAPQLGPGQQYTTTVRALLPAMPAGDYFLILNVDEYDSQYETAEDNNQVLRPIRVLVPDLAVTALDAPSQAAAGREIAVSWSVNNLGAGRAAASWTDVLYLSTDNVLTPDDILLGGYGNPQSLEDGAGYLQSAMVTLPGCNLPSGGGCLEAGTYWLLMRTDDGGAVYEQGGDADNVLSRQIELVYPDLATTVLAAPDALNARQAFRVSYQVANQGGAAAPAIPTVALHLSRDARLDAGDVLLSQTTGVSLAPGGNYRHTLNASLPEEMAGGSWYLLVTADYGGHIAEGYAKSNNTAAHPITVSGGPLADGPNLAALDLTAPGEIVAGQSVTIDWVVGNTGNAGADGSWFDQVFLSRDAQWSPDDVPVGGNWESHNLAPGADYSRALTAVVPPVAAGAWYLLVYADYHNSLSERDGDGDNVRVQPVQVRTPDLAPMTFTAAGDGLVGRRLDVSWTVVNQGDGTAAPDWYDQIFLSRDTQLGPEDTPLHYEYYNGGSANPLTPLGPGEQYTRSASVLIPEVEPGDWHLVLRADSGNYVFEGGAEANNLLVRPLRLQAPDLEVVSFHAPIAGVPDGALALNWQVENRGDGAATGLWWDVVYLSRDPRWTPDDVFMGGAMPLEDPEAPLPNIQPGESYLSNLSVTLPRVAPGDWYLILRADDGNSLPEHGAEANNLAVLPFRVDVADLAVTNLVGPATATDGQVLALTRTVANVGAGSTFGGWSDQFFLSRDNRLSPEDRPLESFSNPFSLAPGEQYVQTSGVLIPPGTETGDYFLLLQTDVGNSLFEHTSEANNIWAMPLHVAGAAPVELPLPNLRGVRLNAPAQATPGQTSALSWVVENAGSVATTGVWYDVVYLSSDTLLTPDDLVLGSVAVPSWWWTTQELRSNEQYARELNVTFPRVAPGTWHLLLYVDRYNQLEEAGPAAGNRLTVPIEILALDLVPGGTLGDYPLEFTVPETGVAGQPLTVGWTIRNAGLGVAEGAWPEQLFLSRDNVLSSDDVAVGWAPWWGYGYNVSPLAPGSQYSRTVSATLPDVPPGDWFLILAADYYNQLFEGTAEANNTAVRPIRVEVPDLAPLDVYAPAAVTIGAGFNALWRVQNVGEGGFEDRYFQDAWYLSRDQHLDPEDVFLGSVGRTISLGAGDIYEGGGEFLVPHLPGGDWFLLMVVNPHGEIWENHETANNVFARPIYLASLDLELQSATISAAGVAGEPVQVSWTVRNPGVHAIPGYWQDTLYLSEDTTLSPDDQSIGVFEHFGPLAAGQSYTETRTLDLPGMLPGSYYLLARTDSRSQIYEGLAEDNNIGASATPIELTIPALATGVALQDEFLGVGRPRFYQIAVPAGRTLLLSAVGAEGAEINLYARHAAIPWRTPEQSGDQRLFSDTPTALNSPELEVFSTAEGIYYLMVDPVSLPWGNGAGFTLRADLLDFSILRVSPSAVGNEGPVTLNIVGADFEPGSTVALINGSERVEAAFTIYRAPTRLQARFDLAGLAPGVYGVQVTRPGGSSTQLPGSVQVAAAQAAELEVTVSSPPVVRIGVWTTLRVEVHNPGNVDITNAYVVLRSTPDVAFDAQLPHAWPVANPVQSNERVLLVRHLAAGERRTVEVRFQANAPGDRDIEVLTWSEQGTLPPPAGGMSGGEGEGGSTSSSPGSASRDNPPPDGSVIMQYDPDGYGTGHVGVRVDIDGQTYVAENLPKEKNKTVQGQQLTPWTDFWDRTFDGPKGAEGEIHYYDPQLSPTQLQNLKNWIRDNAHGDGRDGEKYTIPFNKCTDFVSRAFEQGAGYPLPVLPSPFTTPNDFMQYLLGRNFDAFAPGVWDAVADLLLPEWQLWLYARLHNIAVGSFDPNEKLASAGVGTAQFVDRSSPIAYEIFFENDPEFATAPAQEVFISDVLDPNLDWTTLEFAAVGFGTHRIQFPAGMRAVNTTINTSNPDGSPLLVSIVAGVDLVAGVVKWEFRSLDPATQQLPEDPFAGFLPVNDKELHNGEGFVSFFIRPRSDAVTGTQIENTASIVFDFNAPIVTNTVTNTLDALPPTSAVQRLPAAVTGDFVVHWSGADDAGGSGLAAYDIYVSENGGPYTLWRGTAETSQLFTGVVGNTYAFYSRAKDAVNQIEAAPPVPDATTIVVPYLTRDDQVDGEEDAEVAIPWTALLDNDWPIPGWSITVVSSVDVAACTVTNDPLNRQIRLACSDHYHGPAHFTYTASDGLDVSAQATVTVNVVSVNDPPVFAPLGPQEVNEHSLLTFTVAASDPFDDPPNAVTLNAVNLPPGATFDPATGEFRWTPGEDQHGAHAVVFSATDDGTPNLTTLSTVTITVHEVNAPPELATLDPQTVLTGQLLTFTVTASDPGDIPANVLTLSATGLPSGATFDPATGVFAWTPDDEQIGQYTVTFTVDDDGTPPLSDQRVVTISVEPSNAAPTEILVSNLTVNENAPGAIVGDVTVLDPDTLQSHTFTLSDDRFEVVDGKLKLKDGVPLDYETAATVTLQITATDTGNPPLSLTRTFTIDVQDMNDPPSSISLAPQTIKERVSGAVIGLLTATDQDAGQTHAFAVPDPDSPFEIVGSTLKLKAGRHLDRLESGTVDVLVTVSDSGVPVGTLTQAVSVNVLANPRPWRNASGMELDVNGDGRIVPFDALYIINELNLRNIIGSLGELPTARPVDAAYYYDTNGDGFCTPLDALRVINYLNEHPFPEGESSAGITGATVRPATIGLTASRSLPTTSPAERTASVEPAAAIDSHWAAAANEQERTVLASRSSRLAIDAERWEDSLETVLEGIADEVARGWHALP